jgi:hypothetical protein
MATTGDFLPATNGDFFMATDTGTTAARWLLMRIRDALLERGVVHVRS